MRSGRGEDVAPVEARRDDRQHQGPVLDRPRLDDPTEALGGLDEQPVVRTDQNVAPGRLQGEREPLGDRSSE